MTLPRVWAFPPVNAPKQKKEMSSIETADFNKAQRQVLIDARYLDTGSIECLYVYQSLCDQ